MVIVDVAIKNTHLEKILFLVTNFVQTVN